MFCGKRDILGVIMFEIGFSSYGFKDAEQVIGLPSKSREREEREIERELYC